METNRNENPHNLHLATENCINNLNSLKEMSLFSNLKKITQMIDKFENLIILLKNKNKECNLFILIFIFNIENLIAKSKLFLLGKEKFEELNPLKEKFSQEIINANNKKCEYYENLLNKNVVQSENQKEKKNNIPMFTNVKMFKNENEFSTDKLIFYLSNNKKNKFLNKKSDSSNSNNKNSFLVQKEENFEVKNNVIEKFVYIYYIRKIILIMIGLKQKKIIINLQKKIVKVRIKYMRK